MISGKKQWRLNEICLIRENIFSWPDATNIFNVPKPDAVRISYAIVRESSVPSGNPDTLPSQSAMETVR